ncbi:dormancy-associated protein homolog 3-like isoform X1 [Benincasa hispida]|uniref:dormancy-associated protein homolog 3-like isoform X1 n=1 Tax=Benincasa hispida TaxID=102211 RepID=UPI0019023E8E|nr:dormancy-associated protein homolog 3-like isoform X1 [Benincasa hispida]
MGLLDQLWDDTLAGPTPDSGLGKLRKHPTFASRSASPKESNGKSYEEGTTSSEEAVRVSRRIMIVKPPGYQYGSPPVSPAASSTPPTSPFSENHSDFEEDRHRMLMGRQQTKSDLGLLLLLLTCEI